MHHLVLTREEASALSWLFQDGFQEAQIASGFELWANAIALHELLEQNVPGTPLTLNKAQLQTLTAIVEIGRDRNDRVLRDLARAGPLQNTLGRLTAKIDAASRE